MSFKLHPKQDVAAELMRVILEELDAAVAHTTARGTPAPERLRRARTSTKKVRACLKLMHAAAPKLRRHENRTLAQAARALGAWRDGDAMVDAIERVLTGSHVTLQRDDLQCIQRSLRRHRTTLQPSRAERSRTLRTFVRALQASRRRLADAAPDIDFTHVARGLRRTYKHARDAFAAARSKQEAKAFHKWRKAVKAYAYQCHLLRAAWPPAMKELRHELKDLGRQLGEEHDLFLLARWLKKAWRKHELDTEREIVRTLLALIAARRAELQASALAAGERLFTDRPRVVEDRMKQWWQAASTERDPIVASS